MKTLRLVLQFFDRFKLSAFLITAIMTFSLFIGTYFFGQYLDVSHAYALLERSGLEGSVYFMPDMDGFANASLQNTIEYYTPLFKTIRQFPGVKAVLESRGTGAGYEGLAHTIKLYDPDLLQAFRPKLARGSWEALFEDTAPPGIFNAIVGGTLLHNARIGDMIQCRAYSKEMITVRVVGVLNVTSPSLPAFSIGGDIVDARGMFSYGDVFILEDTPRLVGLLKKENISPGFNVWVVFRDTASESERTEAQAFMESNGTIKTFENIMKASRENMKLLATTTLPLPGFLLFISFISLLSVSTLMIYRKIEDMAVYYLCGCAKIKSYFLMTAGTGIMVLIAAGLNLAFIFAYPALKMSQRVVFYDIIIDERSAVLVSVISLFILLFSLLFPFLAIRKTSPIDSYRRANQ